VSENVIAGPAMLRRSTYQFGPLLPTGPRGQVDAGLGKTTARGSVSLIAPTDLIINTGDRRTLDGL
ncbi:MAG: MBL fold metallo-hydrolase, partial [Hyphomicrobiales bacterium]|nr:MBL fold metallo-hydrolase [Hyphomicrobiales bacterium]